MALRKSRLLLVVAAVFIVLQFMRSGLSLPRVVSRTEVNSNKLRLLRELEKNPKWKTEGFYFQSNNKARLPQLSVLRQKLAVSFPYEPQKPFPKCIWQTWKVGVDDPTFPLMYKSFQQQWSQINPGYKHNVLADNDCHEMVAKLYTSVPEVAKAYQLMPKSILKADFFRYLILYAQGGVYADIDTRGIKPIDSWLSNNKKLYNKPNTAGLVVGIEADPDRPDWNDWYSRRIQFCQWAIQAKKGHPMLKDLIAKITELTLERSKNGQLKTVLGKDEGGDIMDWTGPGIWTDYVFAYMNNILQSEANIKTGQYDEIITWELFTGMQLPIGVDDVLVLPITSFSPNVGHMGSKPTSDPLCYVEHMFSGSWKHDEKPQHKPKKNH